MSHQNLQITHNNLEVPEEFSAANRFDIDYAHVLADFEPAAPGGMVVFSTRGYLTEEEADAAHEAFLHEALGVCDEDD
jgi:hypothetical protein